MSKNSKGIGCPTCFSLRKNVQKGAWCFTWTVRRDGQPGFALLRTLPGRPIPPAVDRHLAADTGRHTVRASGQPNGQENHVLQSTTYINTTVHFSAKSITCSSVGKLVCVSKASLAINTAMALRPSKSKSSKSGSKSVNWSTVKMLLKLLMGIFNSFSNSLPTGVPYSTLETSREILKLRIFLINFH